MIIPSGQLKGLTFNAKIEIGALKAAKLNITNIQLNASGKDGLIKLDPFAADLYQGELRVTGDINTRQEIPKMHIVKDLQGVQLGPMLIDMTGKEEIKGRADIHVDVTTSGMTKNELTRNANGKMRISLTDGEIAKLKIIDTIRIAKTLLGSNKKEEQGDPGRGPSKTSSSSGRSTAFAGLSATGVITNGVFVNNDLLAESELMKVEGKGTVNMVTEQIDYLLTIYLAQYLERDQESGMVELADTPIPYRVKGTFDKIEQSAALEKLLINEGQKFLIKELGKQLGGDTPQDGEKQESSNSTEDLINKGLKSLFGN
jgi:AsmA protein